MFKRCKQNNKQRRPWSDCSLRSSLIWVCTVCSDLSVPIFKIITVHCNTNNLWFLKKNKFYTGWTAYTLFTDVKSLLLLELAKYKKNHIVMYILQRILCKSDTKKNSVQLCVLPAMRHKEVLIVLAVLNSRKLNKSLDHHCHRTKTYALLLQLAGETPKKGRKSMKLMHKRGKLWPHIQPPSYIPIFTSSISSSYH